MAVKVRGLWRHSNGWWYFSRMRQGVKKTVALETRDEKEAIQKALEIADSPALGLTGSLLGEVDAFIAFKMSRNEFSRFSAESKELTLKRFARWIGEDRAIPSIKEADLKRYYDEERKRKIRGTDLTLAESTVQGYMMALRSFFSWLVDERQVIAKNPCLGISMGRWDYGSRTLFCNPAQRDALIAGWKTIPKELIDEKRARWIGFIMHAGMEAGLRKNEIMEARPEWFNLQAGTLRVQKTDTFVPKDREARSIPLTDVFKGFLAEYPMNGTWCIAPEVTRGESRYRYDFHRPYAAYLDHVGKAIKEDLSWVTPHVMRHTFASLLKTAGESLSKISDWMGNDIRVTERHYAHLTEGDKAVNLLHSFAQPTPKQGRRRGIH